MDKSDKEMVLTGIVLDETHVFTLQEIKEKFHIEDAFLNEMVEYGLFEITAPEVDLPTLRRIQTVVHLHHDLEVNLAGAAVVLQLLDELEGLRVQMSIMEKHFK